ncbi:acyl carrier protein [Streptomyces sp. NPDC001073]
MAGRSMKDIPDDAPAAIKEFIGELRAFVQDAAGEGGSVTQIAESGSLSRSTFLGALSGQRMPTHSTVQGIVDSVAKYKSLGTNVWKAMLAQWTSRYLEAEQQLAAERVAGTAAADGRAYDARVVTTNSPVMDHVTVAETVARVLYDSTVREALTTYGPKVPIVVFAGALAEVMEAAPQLAPAEYPALVVSLLTSLERPPLDSGAARPAPDHPGNRRARDEALGLVGKDAIAGGTPVLVTVDTAFEDALQRLDEASDAVRRARGLALTSDTASGDNEWVIAELAKGRFPPGTRRSSPLPDHASRPDVAPTTKLLSLPLKVREAVLRQTVRHEAAAVLGDDHAEMLQDSEMFFEAGFDSVTLVELRNRIGTALGLDLPATLLIDHPTVSAVAVYLQEELLTGRARKAEADGDRGADRFGTREASVDAYQLKTRRGDT